MSYGKAMSYGKGTLVSSAAAPRTICLEKVLAVALLSLAGFVPARHVTAARMLNPDDTLRIETLGSITLAPDGGMIAFVRTRSRDSGPTTGYPWYWEHYRGDVWVANTTDRSVENLTDGSADGSGAWDPKWSPDGTHLAFLSTRGGNGFHIWVWTRGTKSLRQLSEVAVPFALGSWSWDWIDAGRLLLRSRTEEPVAGSEIASGVPQAQIVRQWLKAWEGREPARSVLESGASADFLDRPQDTVVIVDLNGDSRQLTTLPSQTKAEVHSAPRGGSVAIIKYIGADQTKIPGESEAKVYRVSIAERTMEAHPRWQTLSPAIKLGSFAWSPDGKEFAFLSPAEKDSHLKVLRGSVAGALREVHLVAAPESLQWADGGRLLIRAVKPPGKIAEPATQNWWVVANSGQAQNVSESLQVVPFELTATDQTYRTFIGTAGGDLWQFASESGSWTNLTRSFEANVMSLLNSDGSPRKWQRPCAVLAVRGATSASTGHYSLNLPAGAMTRLRSHGSQAHIKTYNCDTNTAVIETKNQGVMVLEIVGKNGKQSIAEINRFLDQIQRGKWQRIEYETQDGKQLIGWLLLPATYTPGVRLPLVTYVYGGQVFEKDLPPDGPVVEISSPSPLNLQFIASRGYAVLFPSMPMKQSPSEPYSELTTGVLSAVDKAVELGFADPDRLAVMGHSYGGFSVYGLVTQTKKFRAAISMAGMSNIVSEYGLFYAHERYQDFPHESWIGASAMEKKWGRMGSPPWKDASRYVRNSPIFHADRVETPLLIIYGDLDYVSITHGEEFFSAMYRQGKRARFVRYWGEGHVLGNSVANFRDFWQQIFVWLDIHGVSIPSAPTY